MIIESPGIYKNITNEDYHASKGISNSSMGLLLPPNCPKLYWYEKLSGLHTRKETDSFQLGTAVHTLAFEPDKFGDRFHLVHKIPGRNSKLGADAHAAMLVKAGTKQILDAEDLAQAKWMAQNLTSHAMWKSLKEIKSGCIEDSIMWKDPDSGALLRTRPDFYNNKTIVDIKTSKDSSPRGFQKSLIEYAYHRQGAMACDGLEALTGRHYDEVVLFVVDKSPPHFVRCYVLSSNALEQGQKEYKQAALIYQQCLDSGIWPGHDEIIEDIDLPQWASK